jgi:hypothetical protein
MSRAWLLLALAASLSGCLKAEAPAASETATGAGEAGQVAYSAPEVTAPPAPAVPLSDTLALDVSGAANDWIVVRQPFGTPLKTLGMKVYLAIEAAQPADGGLLAFVVPSAFPSEDGLWLPGLHDVGLLRPEGDLAIERKGGSSFGFGEPSSEMLLAMSANAPWTLHVRFVFDDIKVPPAQVVRGTGAAFLADAKRDVPVDGPAGQVTLHAENGGPGWDHLQVLFAPLEPDGVRSHTLQLADGWGSDGNDVARGYQTPLGGSASSSRVDYVGSLRDSAGTLEGQVSYVEADSGLTLAAVHIPIDPALLPEAGEGHYMGSGSPFSE